MRPYLTADEASILNFSIATRCAIWALALGSHLCVGVFDDSGHAAIKREGSFWLAKAAKPSVQWDTVHFIDVARHGYRLEQHNAFLPGSPILLRLFGWSSDGSLSADRAVVGTALLAGLLSLMTPVLLHRLTHQMTGAPIYAKRVARLYCLTPSPAVLSVPYTEPFYAFLTFLAMLWTCYDWIWSASCAFALATAFRANGILNAGFIVWYGLFSQPSILSAAAKLPIVAMQALFIAAPFILHQSQAFVRFCGPNASRAWCNNTLPLVYQFAQREYWNVGFLRYFSPQQIPNFALAAPVLTVAASASIRYYSHHSKHLVRMSLPRCLKPAVALRAAAPHPFLSARLLPYIYLHTILSLLLLTASHVQIALRQACTNPVLWWYLAYLADTHAKTARLWLSYCIIWGAVSIALWTAYYAPA